MFVLPILILAIIQISSPAGAATIIARPKTKRVLSKIERIIILPINGLRYGGNSKVKEEGNPFRIVIDNIFDITRVIIIPNITTPVMVMAEIIVENLSELSMNIPVIVISIGKRPLHGTKLLVIVAINLSLGESIILQAIIPAALQPKPMHMVSACFP